MATKTEQCLIRMEEKLDHIHKDVEQNSKDIEELKKEVNMGKGSVKALIFVASAITLIAGLFKYGDGV